MKSATANAVLLSALLCLFGACDRSSNAVSGTIEVDEAHVAPRAPGRVQKIFAREGQSLKAGDPIVELDAAELPAQRDLARAQVDAATRDAEAQMAQLEFLRSEAQRQQDRALSRGCMRARQHHPDPLLHCLKPGYHSAGRTFARILAESSNPDRHVACALLHSRSGFERKLARRFESEAAAPQQISAAGWRHTNVC